MRRGLQFALRLAAQFAIAALTVACLSWMGVFSALRAHQTAAPKGALSGVVFLQRIADGTGTLAPEERAFALPAGWTITDQPAGVLAGTQGGPGQVTGYSQLVPPAGFGPTTISLPVPAVGTPSFTDGTERRTSDRLTTTDANTHSFLALPVASSDVATVRVDMIAIDQVSGGYATYTIADGGAFISSGSMTTVGGAASPTYANTIGYGSQINLVYGGGYINVAVVAPSPGTTGSTDVTSASLYGGGGTLAGGGTGLTLILNVNGAGAQTLTFDGTGATNDASKTAMLAAIEAKWTALTAVTGGSGGNRLQLYAAHSVVVGAGTANTALGLTPGTYSTSDSVLWVGSMRVSAGAE